MANMDVFVSSETLLFCSNEKTRENKIEYVVYAKPFTGAGPSHH